MRRTDRTRGKQIGLKRLVLFLTAFCLQRAAVGARRYQRRLPRRSDSAKFAGAFVNWGPMGREQTLLQWENGLKQSRPSVLGVDFYGEASWEDFPQVDLGARHLEKPQPVAQRGLSVPLTITGTPLADVASGLHDGEFEAAAARYRRRAQGHHPPGLGK